MLGKGLWLHGHLESRKGLPFCQARYLIANFLLLATTAEDPGSPGPGAQCLVEWGGDTHTRIWSALVLSSTKLETGWNWDGEARALRKQGRPVIRGWGRGCACQARKGNKHLVFLPTLWPLEPFRAVQLTPAWAWKQEQHTLLSLVIMITLWWIFLSLVPILSPYPAFSHPPAFPAFFPLFNSSLSFLICQRF